MRGASVYFRPPAETAGRPFSDTRNSTVKKCPALHPGSLMQRPEGSRSGPLGRRDRAAMSQGATSVRPLHSLPARYPVLQCAMTFSVTATGTKRSIPTPPVFNGVAAKLLVRRTLTQSVDEPPTFRVDCQPAAHVLLGSGPISRINVPPAWRSLALIQQRFNGLPFHEADWTY